MIRVPGICGREIRCAALLMLFIPTKLGAQAVSASELKAAFVFNFAKFADWPTLAPDAPITVCVTGDDRVAAALGETIHGQSVDVRFLRLVKLPSDAAVKSCQVLFVSGQERSRLAALVEEAGNAPVLTVSDGDHFASEGGMVELYNEAGRMKFAINVDAVQRARIRLSSRLLGLAKIVRDGHAQ
jgi:hypothetical protein